MARRRDGPSRRHCISAALAAIAVVALTACGTIPTASPSASVPATAPATASTTGTATAPGTAPASSAATSSAATSSPPADLNAQLPDRIRQAGKIVVGVDPSRTPNEFNDGGTITGFDVDLFNAIAAKFGISADYTTAKLSDIIPGVTASRYDIGVSSIPITAARLQDATMISYFTAGTQWAAQKGNPKQVSIDNPCGLTIAVRKGTPQQTTDLAIRQQMCGSRTIKIKTFDDADAVAQAVEDGEADAMVAESTVTGYAVAQSDGALQTVGDIYDPAVYGYALPKDQTDFAAAIVQALHALKADGTYEQILTRWGVQAGALNDFAVNPKP